MIFNLETNELEECYFRKVERAEIIENNYRPRGGWDFDWVKPFTLPFEVYALVTEKSPEIVQGLVAVRPNYDEEFLCVDLEIVESAPHNKRGNKTKLNSNRNYANVGKCLIAFACQYSFNNGLDGYLSLTSKTSKIHFYTEILEGHRNGSQGITFNSEISKKIIKKHLPGGIKWL